VRDEGSWLDIGNSISQFGLVNAQCVFLPLLFWSARLFLRGVRLDTNLADTN
jgi:phosphatidylinositol glycan class N